MIGLSFKLGMGLFMAAERFEALARELLDEHELGLASHLSMLLSDPQYDSGSLIQEILPTYWEKRGEARHVLQPDPIYHPLYYLHMFADKADFSEFTRPFLANAGAHLEGCLLWLEGTRPKLRGTWILRSFGSRASGTENDIAFACRRTTEIQCGG